MSHIATAAITRSGRQKSVRPRLALTLTAAATLLGAGVSLAGPASADSSTCTPGGCTGQASFRSTGELLSICDNLADGLGVRVEYTRTDAPGQDNIKDNRTSNGGGAGTCLGFDFNMPESASITYRVCLLPLSEVPTNCSGWVMDFAAG
ncbi:MAG: hypothetical protein ACRDOO_28240 [Actinomadura sp.]